MKKLRAKIDFTPFDNFIIFEGFEYYGYFDYYIGLEDKKIPENLSNLVAISLEGYGNLLLFPKKYFEVVE